MKQAKSFLPDSNTIRKRGWPHRRHPVLIEWVQLSPALNKKCEPYKTSSKAKASWRPLQHRNRCLSPFHCKTQFSLQTLRATRRPHSIAQLHHQPKRQGNLTVNTAPSGEIPSSHSHSFLSKWHFPKTLCKSILEKMLKTVTS